MPRPRLKKSPYSNGKWNSVNLKFLSRFMEITGQSTKDVAKKVGCTPQSIVHMLTVDDANLSRIEEIMNYYDCIISLQYRRAEEDTSSINIDNSVLDSIPNKYSGKRLSFIRKALSEYGLTLGELRKSLEDIGGPANKSTIDHWFFSDDIKISHCYNIARAINAELVINISVKQRN